MEPSRLLHDDALELLKKLGHAASATGDRLRFEYRPLQGYPLGWLLHPGLRDGLCVTTTADLTALEHAGIVGFDSEGDNSAFKYFVLTSYGWQCYAREIGGSVLPPPDDPTLRD